MTLPTCLHGVDREGPFPVKQPNIRKHNSFFTQPPVYEDGTDRVFPKCRHIKFRRKHTIFRIRRKFEIKENLNYILLSPYTDSATSKYMVITS